MAGAGSATKRAPVMVITAGGQAFTLAAEDSTITIMGIMVGTTAVTINS